MAVAGGPVRRWWFMAAPPLIVTVPLAGFPLQYDEVKLFVSTANRVGANPIRAARHSLQEVGRFLDLGTFRPLGRFLENTQYSAVFETSEATGIAPHAVQGVIRLSLVVALALVAARVVSAVLRSGGARSDHPSLLVYPLVLAATLVAGGGVSPLVLFPLLFTGSVVLVLAVALLVARDRDMEARRLAWRERSAMVLVGAAAAMTYDLVYVAPVLAAVFIAARAVAARMPPAALLRTAAVSRWWHMSVGFLAVFIPSRIEIAIRCGERACYEATKVNPSVDALELVPGRILTGAPPVGWRYNSDLEPSGMQFDLAALAANALMALLLLVVIVWVFVAARGIARWDEGTAGHLEPDPSAGSAGTMPRWGRIAAGLGVLGAAAAVLGAVLVSLARFNQQRDLPVGQAWRDTVLVQVGWSLVIFALVLAVAGALRAPRARRVALQAVVVLLATCLLLTLFYNWRLSGVQGRSPRSTATKQLLIAATTDDDTTAGNAGRCKLLGTFEELVSPMGGLLDEMMLDRYGYPFCDPDQVPAS